MKETARADRRVRHKLISRSTWRIYFGRTNSGNGRLFQVKLFYTLKELKEVIVRIQDGGEISGSHTNLLPGPIWNHN